MALSARLSNSPTEHGHPVESGPVSRLDQLREAIAPSRHQLLDHPLYAEVDSLARLQCFMMTHVYAVWDFMCLAKRLQRDLTSVDVLWRPPKHPALARFINGVVLGEESDVDPDGVPASHLELYLGAMEEVGADTSTVRRFLAAIGAGASLHVALARSGVPAFARRFVTHTLERVEYGSTIEVMAAFSFGREDLIPEMFQRLIPRWGESRNARRFAYYIARHIELDGDDHGPAAERALVALAGDDPIAWKAAERAAEQEIDARIAMWTGVRAEIRNHVD